MSEEPETIDRLLYDAFRETVLSGQMASSEIAALMRENPTFAEWYGNKQSELHSQRRLAPQVDSDQSRQNHAAEYPPKCG